MRMILIAAMAFVMALSSLGQVQQMEWRQQTRQKLKESIDKSRPTGHSILEKIMANQATTPLKMYPPGHLEWLEKIGNEPIPVQETYKSSASSMSLRSGDTMQMQKSFNPATQKYQVVDLGTMYGTNGMFDVYDINNLGQIAGAGPSSGMYVAAMWSNGVMRYAGTLGSDYSVSFGINDKGEMVGISRTSVEQGSETHGFLWSGDAMLDLGTLGGGYSVANAINNDSQIAGSSSGVFGFLGFLWSNGSMMLLHSNLDYSTDVFDINDNSQIVGSIDNNNGYCWENGLITFLDGWEIAKGINNVGMIVGVGNGNALLFYDGVTQVIREDFGGAISVNNNNQIIGKTWIFDYESGESYELQDLIDQNISPGWVLVEARKINDLGQIIGVANSVENGQRPILLNPIPEGWQEIVEEEPVQPEYGDLPVKQTGKSNLVFITHGAIPWWQNEQESISWIYHMSNSIAQYLTANGMHGWQVHAHPWIDGAKFKGLVPLKVLSRGYEEGTVAGRSIAADGWNHVHLISHSAGANLIQAIVDQVKPGPTTVHCTFLDPFVGHDETGVEAYGAGTEWSDQYFSRDRETGGGITKATEEPLDHAHNVDVTRLFKEKVAGYFISSGPNVNQPCVRTISSHAAAIAFYSNTVAGTVSVEYQGYGFPLSLEGGTWGGSPFLVVSNAPVELGTGDPTCYTLFQPVQGSFQSLVPVLNTPAYVTGSVLKYDHGFTAETQSPSWIAQVLSLTNRANYISFEARFESEIGAEGLLTVYWDTNVIGSVDERASVPGFRKYVFSFPMAETTGAHVLAFRLDPFTNVQSVITVTNITLGATGPSEPFRLQVTFDEEGGHRVLELTGQPGFNYVVEGSTNLLNWEPVAIVANTNGAVRFFDAGSTNHNQRFYRASVPLE